MEGNSPKPVNFPKPFLNDGPQRPSALARFLGYARNFAASTIALAALVFMAEKLFVPEYRPSYLMGTFAGSVERAEIGAKQDAAVELMRKQAEAQAQAQARAQIEAEVSRQQQQVMTDSLAAQSFFANGADVVCALGLMFGDETVDKKALCSLGDTLRQNMTRTQAQAGRQGGAVQPRTVDGEPLQ